MTEDSKKKETNGFREDDGEIESGHIDIKKHIL